MTQKVLAGRADDASLSGDFVCAKVDQVVLARRPNRSLLEALNHGLKRIAVELAVAYEPICVTSRRGAVEAGLKTVDTSGPITREALTPGVLIARAGIGFPAPVHLERFASPARLAITDEPRLASMGGASMLTLTVSPSQIADCLIQGTLWLRPPRSIQVLLSGRTRPFVCIRDVALELVRRGLGDVVRRVDGEYGAPVVIEFTGPSARLLSVAERAVLCGLAPQLGAAGALFVSDEKTEVYLRDQRRSKAHRALYPDPGAPCDDAVSLDLSAVDPLIQDDQGVVRAVRELADAPVSQVVLGGDTGTTLRDLLAVAALLKSKRVPSRLDFLVAPPSRQALEVLAQSGALADLIATGARVIEPDQRVLTGELYPPASDGASLRTYDPEPQACPVPGSKGFMVGSAESLAWAVATGAVGDPRGFKRPVRITVPRNLPTEDVMVVRKGKGKGKGDGDSPKTAADPTFDLPLPWRETITLALLAPKAIMAENPLSGPIAILCDSLEAVNWTAARASALSPQLRAVIAQHIPAGTVPVFAGLGILALTANEGDIPRLRGENSLRLPEPKTWNGEGVTVLAGADPVQLRWRAMGTEREWTELGTARLASKPVHR